MAVQKQRGPGQAEAREGTTEHFRLREAGGISVDFHNMIKRQALHDTLRKVALLGPKLPGGLESMTRLQVAAEMLIEDYRYFLAREPRIMTLDEAAGADYAFIEYNKTQVKCTSVYPVSVYISPDCKRLTIKRIGAADIDTDFDTYGFWWRCWTAEPTEEQRKEASWEDGKNRR